MAVETIKNLIKKVNGVIYSYFSTKMLSLIIVYTIFELTGSNAAMWESLMNAIFVDIEKEGYGLALIQASGFLMILILLMEFAIFTFILDHDLHSGEGEHIELYMAYFVLTTIVSVICCFMSQLVLLMNPTDTLERVISVGMFITINGFFLYILRAYCIKLGYKQIEMNSDEANA